MRLSRVVRCIVVLLSGPGWSERAPSAGGGWSPATYQVAMLPLHHRTVGKVGVEPTVSCSQGTRGTVPLHPVVLFFELARMGVEPISSP